MTAEERTAELVCVKKDGGHWRITVEGPYENGCRGCVLVGKARSQTDAEDFANCLRRIVETAIRAAERAVTQGVA